MKRAGLALLVLTALAAPAAVRPQLGLDLTAPEPKKSDAKKKDEPKAKAPAKAAPRPEATPAPARPPVQKARPGEGKSGLELSPIEAGGRGDAKPRLEAAKKLAEAGKHQPAALAFDEILREPQLAEGHDEARYQLAKSLAQLGLHHAALTYLDEILDRGPSRTKYFHSALEWLFYIGRRLGNEQAVLTRVARHARDGAPPDNQDRFYLMLAKYEFERGRALEESGQPEEARAAWTEARRLAGLVRADPPPSTATAGAKAFTAGVPPDDAADVFARTQFIDGLALYALRQEQAATEKFKDVVRLTNPRKGRAGDPELREQAFLQLARVHYQNRQNRYAIFYYGKMPWGGPSWLEGLWEASYAHYRIGEHEKSLGNLLTLQSAYFKDEYYPESWVLKAIIYYENCRYPEASSVLKDFNAVYEPLYDQLVALTARPAASSAFLDQLGGGKVQKLAYTDQNIRRLVETAREVDAEADRGVGGRDAAFRASPLGKALLVRLAREKTQLATEAGLRARGKLEYERDQLRSMLAQALRIQIEVSRQEREALESSLAAGSQVEVVKNLRWTHAVSDEQLYWPYEGEFWRDELGTYSYTLTKGCKDRPPRSSGR
jgi:tetratricopeptide (TPR) repeat protein